MMKAVLALLVATTAMVSANTITWTGFGPDNLWSTALNWDGNAVPGPQDTVVFHNGTCVANNYVAIASLTMGDRLEAKASLTVLNNFFVSGNFQSFQNGDVSLTSGSSALNGIFSLKGGFTFQSGSVSGTITASGPSDLSGAAAKTVKTGSLTLSGTSKVGGVVSLDGTKPLLTVTGSSSWSGVHLMPTQNATGAQFDASSGSVAIDSDVSIQANGKFGALSIVNKANMSIYSDVSFANTLNIPNNSFVSTIGSAEATVLISGGGNFVAGGKSTTFGAIDFPGMIGCTGVACIFNGKKSTVGNLVAYNGAVSFAKGTSTSANILSINKAQVSVAGSVSAAQFNILDGGMLSGNIMAQKFYAKNSNSFNLQGSISVATASIFDGAQFNFLPSGGIILAKGSNNMVSGILKLGGTPTAAGISNNGMIKVSNLVASTNVNFKGTGAMSLSSAISVSGAEFGAGTVTMSSGAAVTGSNACLNVAAFNAAQVKGKIDSVSFTCEGGCNDVVAACSPRPPTDSFSFSA